MRPLRDEEKRCICQFIRAFVPVARITDHPFRKIAEDQISLLMWRWTADGVNTKTGLVRKDGLKRSIKFQRHTRKACKVARTSAKSLRHEHVVPRNVLAREIVDKDMSEGEIHRFLTKFCLAAIVTKKEDQSLNRAEMPEDWDFSTGNPFQRYVDAKLIEEMCDVSHND